MKARWEDLYTHKYMYINMYYCVIVCVCVDLVSIHFLLCKHGLNLIKWYLKEIRVDDVVIFCVPEVGIVALQALQGSLPTGSPHTSWSLHLITPDFAPQTAMSSYIYGFRCT